MEKRKLLYEGQYLRLIQHRGWEFIQRTDCTGIVVIAAMTPEREVVLVEQYRIPVGCAVIELPAGLVGDTPDKRRESMAGAARRELLEETGFHAKKMERLICGPVSSGMSGQQITFYRASGLVKKGPGGGDALESIQPHVIPLARVMPWLEAMQKKGRLIDPKIFVGLYFLRQSV